jgi:hypothetical protein
MHNTPPDTAQVIVLPPLVHGAAFIMGLLLHLLFPLHILPNTLARGIGVVCVLVSCLSPSRRCVSCHVLTRLLIP